MSKIKGHTSSSLSVFGSHVAHIHTYTHTQSPSCIGTMKQSSIVKTHLIGLDVPLGFVTDTIRNTGCVMRYEQFFHCKVCVYKTTCSLSFFLFFLSLLYTYISFSLLSTIMAEAILDFSKELDVTLLDQVVMTLFTGSGSEVSGCLLGKVDVPLITLYSNN